MDKDKVAILLFEAFHGRKHIGSSRIRGHWLRNYWTELELFQQGGKYDVIIFQKVYWLEYVKAFKGIKILDTCDPDWLDTMPVKEVMDNCDAITTSTEVLRDEIKKFTDKPVIFIPDRQDLQFHNKQKKHKGIAKKVVWFGYSHNVKVLSPTIATLRKYNLKLTVISDRRPPYSKANENVKYDPDNPEFDFSNEILKADFALLPEDTSPRGRFKSKNKTYTAWALGMPVATNPQEVKRFLEPREREKEARFRLAEIREKFDVRDSVKEFKQLIEQIKRTKNEN